MRRQVEAKKDYKLILKDRFSNPQGKAFELKAGLNELECPAFGGYYQSEDNERFFIYEGEGVLELEIECVKEYNFENINMTFLDFYLGNHKHHKNADESDKKIIENFLTLFNLNEMLEKPKIVPPFYAAILARIFNND